ncbi:MAG: MFS transporter, partial [Steroidobacteraceae bacterium]|nr:MFS transporter [Steroidobacteraceae bacterium]
MSNNEGEQPGSACEHNAASEVYGWFLVGLLILAALVSYIDRQVIAIVVGPMRADLGISDTEIGWLYGIFAVFFALAGMPLAMLADRYNRMRLIAAGIFLWSLMTAGCGLARSFVQILLARIGVGVGEAVLTPAANSLIADAFPRPRVPLAVSVFMIGATVGSGLAFVVGGAVLGLLQGVESIELPLLGRVAPWQQLFLWCALPGLALAPLFLWMREPVRQQPVPKIEDRGTLVELWAFYSQHRATLILHHLGFLCLSLMGFAFVFWTVAFFSRVHGMDPARAAVTFGWIFVVMGSLGSIWTPLLALRLAQRGHRDANIVAAMIGGGAAMLAISIVQTMPSAFWAFVLYVPAMFFNASPFGLAYGSLPVITPPRMRAFVTSVFMCVVNLGMLLGPPIAGFFNDKVFPDTDGVRWSLLTIAPFFGLLGLTLLALCRRHYARSML